MREVVIGYQVRILSAPGPYWSEGFEVIVGPWPCRDTAEFVAGDPAWDKDKRVLDVCVEEVEINPTEVLW